MATKFERKWQKNAADLDRAWTILDCLCYPNGDFEKERRAAKRRAHETSLTLLEAVNERIDRKLR